MDSSDEEEEAPPPSATFVHCTSVYINGLNEKIKIPELIEGIRGIFGECGPIIEIIAKKSLKRRGQAFVVYESVEDAQDAITALQDFILFDKQIHVEFAKTRSDHTVLREDGEEALQQHKTTRLADKDRKNAIEEAAAEAARVEAAKRPAPEELVDRSAKAAKPAQAAGGVVPDEYLPPNKVLFLRELPEDYGKDALTTIWSRFPGFKELRVVPGRKGIAFVEYEDEDGAVMAKDATANMTLGDKAIRVTYQRQ
ncbi:hypothetical protein LTR08_009089 [Meristemomyces frigidus]|nr:hypothetical protein LTR08_009089 [Meristemomyces frigidus]